jgi:hypothetical protein
MSPSEELVQLAEALANETDTERALQLSEDLLAALDRMEARKNASADVA